LRQNFRYEKFTALLCPEFIEGAANSFWKRKKVVKKLPAFLSSIYIIHPPVKFVNVFGLGNLS